MSDKTIQYKIYIGLNDADSGEQKLGTERYESALKNVCRHYGVAFSVHRINGGYYHEDGRYTEENTLELMLMNVSAETVEDIARDLCAFFHQESVMITESPCAVHFISETI